MPEVQKQRSSAVWTVFRNALRHEEIVELKAAGHCYQNCRDTLSAVSRVQRTVAAASRAEEDDDLPDSAAEFHRG